LTILKHGIHRTPYRNHHTRLCDIPLSFLKRTIQKQRPQSPSPCRQISPRKRYLATHLSTCFDGNYVCECRTTHQRLDGVKKIQAIGKFFPVDAQGFIQNPCNQSLIATDFLPIINVIIKKYQSELGADLHSVYLRGSIPRGFAKEHIKDIDTFALLQRQDIKWQQAVWAGDLEKEITENFDFQGEIEVMLTTWYKDFYKYNPRMAMVIQTQSLCIYGEDISSSLPRFKVGKDLMLNYNWLAQDVQSFINKKDIEKADIELLMKVLLRVGMELVMQREGKYTPDLYLCYHTFSKYYPQWEAEMRQALDYFLNPRNDSSVMRQFVKRFSPKVINEVQKVLM